MPANINKFISHFVFNQTITIKDAKVIIENKNMGTDNIVVRVTDFHNINKDCERYLKNFQCLTPNGHHSRLYIIPETELVRQQDEQKGQASTNTSKGIKKSKQKSAKR